MVNFTNDPPTDYGMGKAQANLAVDHLSFFVELTLPDRSYKSFEVVLGKLKKLLGKNPQREQKKLVWRVFVSSLE